MSLIEIKKLHARVAAPNGLDVLKGVNLTINPGEVHAIMGKGFRARTLDEGFAAEAQKLLGVSWEGSVG